MLKILMSIFLFAGLAQAADKEMGLNNQSELGYVVTGGNSKSETTSVKQTSTYKWDGGGLTFTGHYIQASGEVDNTATATVGDTKNEITAENWSAKLRYDKTITPKWFSAFASHGWRGDRFQGVEYGHDSDIGAKYFTANDDTYKQFFELGYRYTREFFNRGQNGTPPSNCQLAQTPLSQDKVVGTGDCGYPEFHYARIFAQADYIYSKTFSVGVWVEYLPSVIDPANDQRINFSPYLTSVLTDIFSLKVAYEHRYRFEAAPDATEYNDFTFTTALLAKF